MAVMPTLTRKSVPVDIHLCALADAITIEDSLERHAVESMVGPLPANLSESAALATLLNLAEKVVGDLVLEAHYAALAASRDEEDNEYEMAVRKRRARRDAEVY